MTTKTRIRYLESQISRETRDAILAEYPDSTPVQRLALALALLEPIQGDPGERSYLRTVPLNGERIPPIDIVANSAHGRYAWPSIAKTYGPDNTLHFDGKPVDAETLDILADPDHEHHDEVCASILDHGYLQWQELPPDYFRVGPAGDIWAVPLPLLPVWDALESEV